MCTFYLLSIESIFLSLLKLLISSSLHQIGNSQQIIWTKAASSNARNKGWSEMEGLSMLEQRGLPRYFLPCEKFQHGTRFPAQAKANNWAMLISISQAFTLELTKLYFKDQVDIRNSKPSIKKGWTFKTIFGSQKKESRRYESLHINRHLQEALLISYPTIQTMTSMI